MKLLAACFHTLDLFVILRWRSRILLEFDDMHLTLWSVWQVLFDVCLIYWADAGFRHLPISLLFRPSAEWSRWEFLLNVLINRTYMHTINETQLKAGIIKHFHSTKWGNVWESTLQTVKPYTDVSYHNYCCYRKPGFYILLFCFPLTLNSKSKYRQPISLKTCCSFLNSSERFIKVLL